MLRTRFSAPVAACSLLLVVCLAVSGSASPGRPGDVGGGPPTKGGIEKVTLGALAREGRLWVPGELIVRFRSRVARADETRVLSAHSAKVKSRVPGSDLAVVDLAPGESVVNAMRELKDNPAVAHAEPNKLIYATGTAPNDPRWDDLWGLHNTGQSHPITDPPPATMSGTVDADGDVLEAWDKETGVAGSVVAVVDSGVAVGHPDLDNNIWTNPGEIPGNNMDDDDNGLVDDVNGWDFGEGDKSLLDGASIEGFDHGTHVAGTIAAQRDNNKGIAGVCPECSIMVLKFMRPTDTNEDGDPDTMVGTLAAELRALAYARQKNADIVNASFTSYLWSQAERRAYKKLGRAGVLAVTAAGNSSLDNDMLLSYEFPDGSLAFSPEYPASFDVPHILSVAASNHKDEYGYFSGCDTEPGPRWPCHFTSWGHDSVDLAAPGVDIVSSVPGGNYQFFNGTSMAAPFTAGTAALVESEHPDYGPMKLKNAVMNSVDQPDTLREMHAFEDGPAQGRFTRTSGRVNTDAALTAPTGNATPETDGNIGGAKRMRRSKRGRVNWPADTNDVFKRRLRKGKKYKVVLNGPRRRDLDLVVWKPGTKEIWQLENGCFLAGSGSCKMFRYIHRNDGSPGTEQTRFTTKQAGIYYFHVSAYFEGGRYTLKVRRV